MHTRLSLNTRYRAALAVQEVVQQGRTLDAALESVTAPLPAADAALVHEMAYGTLRWYYRLQALVRRLLARPLKRRDGDIETLLLVGLYQLGYMRTPAHAAVSETVAATRDLGKDWASGLVNAVLRRYQREGDQSLAARIDAAARYAHPAWLVDAVCGAWPQRWQQVLAANNERPPMVLRVNLRAQSRDQYLERLCAAGLSARAHPRAATAVVLATPVAVERLPGFSDGAVSVQDAAAQQAAAAMDLAPGQRVLDACAAPGGKTGHLLEAEPALAELVAVDADAGRLQRVEENLRRLGLQAAVVCADAAVPARWWDGVAFDRILLDAPCSGTGVIRRHPDIKLLRLADDVASQCAQQQRLLEALWPLLAVGGRLVYVTCSILPAENGMQIDAFLRRHADARAVACVAHCGRAAGPGRQILPGDDDMDGFYYACLEKLT